MWGTKKQQLFLKHVRNLTAKLEINRNRQENIIETATIRQILETMIFKNFSGLRQISYYLEIREKLSI